MTKARDIATLLSTANGKIAGENLDVSFENITDIGTEGTKVATGTSAQRGSTTGQLRFNTDTGLAEYYDGVQFKSIDAPPIVSSISPTSLGQSVLGSSQSIVITGSNFSPTVTATIIGDDGTEFTPASTTRNSNTQVTITTPTNLTHTNEPYDIKIENNSNLSSTLTDALEINDTPVFATASGSLGSLQDGDRSASNLTPISFSDEESTPTLSVTTGSIPAGLTLNSDGTFSGTATSVSTSTTSNFTVTATDGSETAEREFSITVNPAINVDFLVIAGGGSGGTGGGGSADIGGGGGGGAGGYRNSFNSETSGGGGSSEGTLSLVAGTQYTVTVGAGASGTTGTDVQGTSGSNSVFATITSIGGGGGGSGNDSTGSAGLSGGSGGGAGETSSGGGGTSGQGFNGGSSPGNNNGGAGGGGAGQAGSTTGGNDGANGGNGVASSINGSSTTRAGGGGGGANSTASPGSGGSGGGGAGGTSAGNGAANTGSGGGGGSDRTPRQSGNGGSGLVILRLPTAVYSGTTTGSPTVSTSGTDTILTFNASGSYTA